MDNKPVLEWVRIDPELTPEEQAQRDALQAEIDRLNGEIKAYLQQIADNLNEALARRIRDVTKR